MRPALYTRAVYEKGYVALKLKHVLSVRDPGHFRYNFRYNYAHEFHLCNTGVRKNRG